MWPFCSYVATPSSVAYCEHCAMAQARQLCSLASSKMCCVYFAFALSDVGKIFLYCLDIDASKAFGVITKVSRSTPTTSSATDVIVFGFGSSLSDLCEQDGLTVPRFIQECVLAVENRGTEFCSSGITAEYFVFFNRRCSIGINVSSVQIECEALKH